jgi:hypothetical protein
MEANPNLGNLPPVLINDLAANAAQADADLGGIAGKAAFLPNVAIGTVDLAASSIANVLTLGAAPDTFAPASWGRYQRNRGLYQAPAAIGSLFVGVGAGNAAIRAGGAMSRLALKAGMPEAVAAKMFAQVDRLADLDKMTGDAWVLKNETIGNALGFTTPNIVMKGSTTSDLAAQGIGTFEELTSITRNLRTANAVKQGIAQELVTFGIANNSQLLYGDGGFLPIAGMAGVGIGLNVGLEHVAAAAVKKKMIATAARKGQAAALESAAQNGFLTPRNTSKGVIGAEWEGLAAQLYGLERTDGLVQDAAGLAQKSQGALTRESLVKEATIAGEALKAEFTQTTKRMAGRTLTDPVLSRATAMGGGVSQGAISRVVDVPMEAFTTRARSNPNVVLGLADITDIDAPARLSALIAKHEDDAMRIDLAMTSTKDPAKLAAMEADLAKNAQALETLRGVRGATIETTGVVNYSDVRLKPFWEVDAAAGVKHEIDGVRLHTDRSVGAVTIKHDGTLARTTSGNMKLPVDNAIDDTGLDFAELTASYQLVGKAAKNAGFQEKFWNSFLTSSAKKLQDLPVAMLDAIHSGVMKIPESLAGSPKGMQITQALQNNGILAISLAKKLDVYKALKLRGGLDMTEKMDVFDFEKALNLKLTDNLGRENPLMSSIAEYDYLNTTPNGLEFITGMKGSPDDMLDRFFELGLAASGNGTKIQQGHAGKMFNDGLAGIGALEAHDKPGGIGALYHHMAAPIDSEKAAMNLMAAQQAMRQHLLVRDGGDLFNGVASMAQADPTAFRVATGVSGLVSETPGLVSRTFGQTTFSHRYQQVIQAVHMVGQRAQGAIDNWIVQNVQPVAEMVRAVHRDKDVFARVAPEFSAAYELIRRGVALEGELFNAGRNKIIMDRAGAQRMLENLGPLQGAPAKGDPWELFDLSIAANEGRYVPISLSNEAADVLNAHAGISAKFLQTENALRAAQGYQPIKKLNGHMPLANFSRYKMKFIQDETGHVVGYVRSKTDEGAQLELDRVLNGPSNKNKNLMEITTNQIREFKDAIDSSFVARLSDYSGIKQTGGSAGRNMDFRLDATSDTFEEIAIAMRNTAIDLKNRSLAQVFQGPLAELQHIKRTMGVTDDMAKGAKIFSPADQWQNLLFATGRLPEESVPARANELINDVVNWATGKMSPALNLAHEAASALVNGTKSKLPFTKSQESWAEQVVRNYTPFNHLANHPELGKYLKLDAEADSFKAARVLQLANRAGVSQFLKMANVHQPLMTMASVIVTSRSVLRNIQPMPGEALDMWRSRVGMIAEYLDPEKGIATLSPEKIIVEGFHRFTNDMASMEFAAANGHLGTNMLEELHKLNNLKPQKFVEAAEAFAKYADFINGPINWMITKGTGKAPKHGTLAERGEEAARAIFHMQGLSVAKRLGRDLSEAEQHNFARMLADQNIADFSPNIRGQAFRGVSGIPFGLFQSFMVNATQRMFGYIENKNARAMASQVFTQFAMFGAEGLPGWPAANALVHQVDNGRGDLGSQSLNERVYNSMGKSAADFIMGGTLAQIPNMMGGDTSLDFSSSTGLNPSMPFSSKPAAFGMIQQVGEGVIAGIRTAGEEIPKLFNEKDFDSSRFAEVIATYAPSRGYRSLADLMLGERRDRAGNLVAEDTRSGVALLSRALGSRTRNERMLQEGLAQNAQMTAQRNAKLDKVRRQVMNSDWSDEEASKYLVDYLQAGGIEDSWPRWLKSVRDKSENTRGQRRLEDVSTKAGQTLWFMQPSAKRLFAAGALPEDALPKTDTMGAISGGQIQP